MLRRLPWSIVAASLVALALATGPGFARELFQGAPQAKGIAASDDPAVVRSRAVHVDFDALLDDAEAFAATPVSELTLNVFPDVTLAAAHDPNASDVSKRFAWVGRTDDGGQVVLVASGGQLAGSVKTRQGSYRILPAGPGGLHVVEEVDLSLLPDEAEPIALDESTEAGLPFDVEKSLEAAPKAEDGSLIDLLVVYTPAARAPASLQGGIEPLIDLGVAETNTAFANSGIDTRIRLVHVAELDYSEGFQTSIQTLLNRLSSPNDGHMDEVHALRDQYQADLVQLVGSSTSGGCGVGYLMRGSSNRLFERQAFSYTAARCITPGYTLAHEVGHNLGSNHALGDPVGFGAFNYSYGYKDPEHGFRTIMAYPCEPESCPRVLHFSNPAVSFDGQPTGALFADNARSINNVRALVANFRVGNGAGSGKVCRNNRSTFVGCKGGACKVCAEKIAGYSRYLANHPGCIVNSQCRGRGYAKCSVTCPAPTEADR